MQTRSFFLQAITPVHSGTGQDSAGVVDLPVAREAATGFPVIPASSLKGVLRDGRGLKKDEEYRPEELEAAQKARKIYGFAGRRKTGDDQYEDISQVGDLTLTDARLLFLPVRSYAGTFALLTCPLVLQRWRRDAEALGIQMAMPEVPAPREAQVYVSGREVVHNSKVILEDIDLEVAAQTDELAKALSQAVFDREEAYFLERFALVGNNVFSYFCQTGLEVIARVRLEPDSKTVAPGALWYEEAIPAEALFSFFALYKNEGDIGEITSKPYLQIGGKASVGRGLLRVLGGRR